MEFVRSIRDLASTRKFWVGLAGVLLDAAIVYASEFPELSPLVKALTVFGIWRVPNKQR